MEPLTSAVQPLPSEKNRRATRLEPVLVRIQLAAAGSPGRARASIGLPRLTRQEDIKRSREPNAVYAAGLLLCCLEDGIYLLISWNGPDGTSHACITHPIYFKI